MKPSVDAESAATNFKESVVRTMIGVKTIRTPSTAIKVLYPRIAVKSSLRFRARMVVLRL
jgi:hypothetical protein